MEKMNAEANKFDKELGTLLRQKRDALNLSQKELAAILKIKPKVIERLLVKASEYDIVAAMNEGY